MTALDSEFLLFEDRVSKVGYFCVICGLLFWILSTTLMFLFPCNDTNNNECALALYCIIAAFDMIVSVIQLWFIIKTRWMLSFFIAVIHFIRFLILFLGSNLNIPWLATVHSYQKTHFWIIWYFVICSFLSSAIIFYMAWMDVRQQWREYMRINGQTTVEGVEIQIHQT